ncbi:PREDICTED: uncharacterized protein LOC105571936 [Cercocebus atys]|uniref:uncharacterized protein LOC105571936 n=1 Tax=Cercocebus atys TaxID=9531 RepID=UPI0005F39B47|nr:PREDICTED: uncharacterized protein LOC105571936 [Cercocebus atys]
METPWTCPGRDQRPREELLEQSPRPQGAGSSIKVQICSFLSWFVLGGVLKKKGVGVLRGKCCESQALNFFALPRAGGENTEARPILPSWPFHRAWRSGRGAQAVPSSLPQRTSDYALIQPKQKTTNQNPTNTAFCGSGEKELIWIIWVAPSRDRTQQINLQRRPCEGGGHSQGMKDGHQKLEEATDPPLEPLAGAQPTPRSQPSGPACFKLLGLWGFVRAAPGSHPQYPRSTPLHFLIYSFASPPPQTPPLVTRMPLNSPVRSPMRCPSSGRIELSLLGPR